MTSSLSAGPVDRGAAGAAAAGDRRRRGPHGSCSSTMRPRRSSAHRSACSAGRSSTTSSRSARRSWRWRSRSPSGSRPMTEYRVRVGSVRFGDAAEDGSSMCSRARFPTTDAPRRAAVSGAHHGGQDRPPAGVARRRAIGHGPCLDAGARDQESAVGHSRRGATARTVGDAGGAAAGPAGPRGDRPHRRSDRPRRGVR